ncbi:hypothetical protein PILCRDRAFT_823389 [Piloderma croceum F 1598]|uniref:Uncharacterized protein n=1 Tax=Piloderma croceum (strain F 1598) TaxID=765440 RepID=A0A0C3F3Z4_PILCF|nr:hypothetical protein PILCRDRAFT_823389 [Piloderma croceum F 1598]
MTSGVSRGPKCQAPSRRNATVKIAICDSVKDPSVIALISVPRAMSIHGQDRPYLKQDAIQQG